MITINGQKMGKSLGNFITLDELFTGSHKILAQAYTPMTIRFFILQAHYRSTLDFSNDALQAAEKGLKRILQAAKDLKNLPVTNATEEVAKEVAALKENVFAALCDDLNTPIALSHLFDAVRIINTVKDGKMAIGATEKETLSFLFSDVLEGILGVVDEQASEGASAGNMGVIEGLMEMVLAERVQATAEKNWAKSDQIRDKLKEIGVQIKDTKNGVEWSI
jgi:cysteinyl-tRNA synthetase